MAAKQLGTILPTRESLAKADAHADKQAKERERIASKNLAECTRRIVGGEVRYYESSRKYAIVSRSNEIFWFEVREDGDYRI